MTCFNSFIQDNMNDMNNYLLSISSNKVSLDSQKPFDVPQEYYVQACTVLEYFQNKSSIVNSSNNSNPNNSNPNNSYNPRNS